MHTIFDLQRYASRELKAIYDENEVRSLCSLVFQHILQYTNIEIHLKKYEFLEKRFVDKFLEIVERLKKNEPYQYILGETEFAEGHFRLNSSTLIPRPETEELVVWVVDSGIKPGARVLDIGTGSGCIAISLARSLAGVEVCGVDIASDAVAQAAENARLNQVEVAFLERDILQYERWPWAMYDVIVSNPPYVREEERVLMHARVLDYEPARALFVPDEDPLLFYRKIARFARHYLRPGGYLFFEINEAFGTQMQALLSDMGFQEVTLKQDINGKDRFIRAVKARFC